MLVRDNKEQEKECGDGDKTREAKVWYGSKVERGNSPHLDLSSGLYTCVMACACTHIQMNKYNIDKRTYLSFIRNQSMDDLRLELKLNVNSLPCGHWQHVTTGISQDSIPVSLGDIHTETGNIVTTNPPVLFVLILIEGEVERMVCYILSLVREERPCKKKCWWLSIGLVFT